MLYNKIAIETTDGASKTSFKSSVLMNKSQLKLASYIQKNKNFIWHDQKIFWNIREYYLKNIQIQNRQKIRNHQKLYL